MDTKDTTKEYEDLFGTSHKGYKSVPPEEEFFKSVYIGGNERKNHIGIVEKSGKLHIRGFSYNLDRVTFLITHVKNVLVKVKTDPKSGRDVTECFSYLGDKGTSGRTCGSNSAERAAVEYCNSCRSNLIISGIHCDENGKPYVDDKSQLVRIFIRARGMKYIRVRGYLDKLASDDVEPAYLDDQSPKARSVEKTVINNKRFVTILTVTEDPSKNYGIKKVFQLDRGVKVPREVTEAVLKDAKNTLVQFNEKFDWSRNKAAVSYVEEQAEVEKDKPDVDQTFAAPTETPNEKAVNQFIAEQGPEKSKETEKKEAPKGKTVNFEDIQF